MNLKKKNNDITSQEDLFEKHEVQGREIMNLKKSGDDYRDVIKVQEECTESE
jgi:hypothetical protein